MTTEKGPSMLDLTLLVVAYYFPPNSEVGGRRISRFCQHFPEFGIRPVVLTIDPASCETTDISLRTTDQLVVRYVAPKETILDKYRRWATKRCEPYSGNHLGIRDNTNRLRLQRLRRHALALLQFPDAKRGWQLPARRAAGALLNEFRIDAILSSGPPWTAHSVAYSISRRYRLPWIADFRDGWASDPWRKSAGKLVGIPLWRDWLDQRTEDRWTRHASLIVCTTSQQRDSLLRAHPRLNAERVVTVTNGLDLNTRFGRRIPRSGPRVLLHAGSLYANRRVGSFCRAVETLVSKCGLTSDSIRVVLMGDVDREIECEAKSVTPHLFDKGIIVFRNRLDWQKGQEALRQADVLLIFQGNHSTAIPAKFYEYLQTGKPILAVVGDGALRDAVLRTGSGVVVSPDDETEIIAGLEQVLQMPQRTAEEVRRICQQFDFRKLTADLVGCVRNAVQPSMEQNSLWADAASR